MASDRLTALGFGEEERAALAALGEPGMRAARVAIEYRDSYAVLGEHGEEMADAGGRLHHDAQSRLDLPTVGDWVALRSSSKAAVVVAVLPRRTRLVRRAAGRRNIPQLVAANLDVVFVVASLNQDFNARRLDRYVGAVVEGGARPVLVLNKADLCGDASSFAAALGPTAAEVPVAIVSAKEHVGREQLERYLEPRQTVAFVGSSGVGKSSLINWLLGTERQAIGEIRGQDDRGRHVTTRRELIVMPSGAVLIDTPGMREFEPWRAEEGLAQVFEDIEAMAGDCRFTDCSHDKEPGCAVRAALQQGALAEERYQQYRKLLVEQRAQAQRELAASRRRPVRPAKP